MDLGIALPDVDLDAELCCKIVAFELQPPPLPIPALLTDPGVQAIIDQAFSALREFFDAAQFSCPLEGPLVNT